MYNICNAMFFVSSVSINRNYKFIYYRPSLLPSHGPIRHSSGCSCSSLVMARHWFHSGFWIGLYILRLYHEMPPYRLSIWSPSCPLAIIFITFIMPTKFIPCTMAMTFHDNSAKIFCKVMPKTDASIKFNFRPWKSIICIYQ